MQKTICLVNCAKPLDILPPVVLMAEVKSEFVKEEILFEAPRSRRGSGINPDALAMATQWTKRCLEWLNERWITMQHTKAVR